MTHIPASASACRAASCRHTLPRNIDILNSSADRPSAKAGDALSQSLSVLRELLPSPVAGAGVSSACLREPGLSDSFSIMDRDAATEARRRVPRAVGDANHGATGTRHMEEVATGTGPLVQPPADVAKRTLPLPVRGLEQGLKVFHEEVNDALIRYRARPACREQLNVMTSLLEDVMDLQGKIAAKKTEASLTNDVDTIHLSLPRNAQLASKMVMKYHQQMCRLVNSHQSTDMLAPRGEMLARTPTSVGSDQDAAQLPPFILDIDSLQDCSCPAAADSSNLTSAELEAVLDSCHRRLYHSLPDLAIDNLIGAAHGSSVSPAGAEKVALEVMSLLMPVINDERQCMASLFGVVIEVMHILCEEHHRHQRHAAEIQQEHRAEFQQMEGNMSKQIVQLLRVVQRQDAEIRELRGQTDEGRSRSSLSPFTGSGVFADAKERSWMSSSLPNVHSSAESLVDALPRRLRQRSSSLSSDTMPHPCSPSLSAASNGGRWGSGDMGDWEGSVDSSVSVSGHWLARAMAWLQPISETNT